MIIFPFLTFHYHSSFCFARKDSLLLLGGAKQITK